MVKARRPEVKFLILGYIDEANPESLTREEIAAWEEEGVIEYLGSDENVTKHIAASHCVVLPSYREGISTTLVEAANSRIPRSVPVTGSY